MAADEAHGCNSCQADTQIPNIDSCGFDLDILPSHVGHILGGIGTDRCSRNRLIRSPQVKYILSDKKSCGAFLQEADVRLIRAECLVAVMD